LSKLFQVDRPAIVDTDGLVLIHCRSSTAQPVLIGRVPSARASMDTLVGSHATEALSSTCNAAPRLFELIRVSSSSSSVCSMDATPSCCSRSRPGQVPQRICSAPEQTQASRCFGQCVKDRRRRRKMKQRAGDAAGWRSGKGGNLEVRKIFVEGFRIKMCAGGPIKSPAVYEAPRTDGRITLCSMFNRTWKNCGQKRHRLYFVPSSIAHSSSAWFFGAGQATSVLRVSSEGESLYACFSPTTALGRNAGGGGVIN
jgi:hypothetical protein